jgi:hypothetical protein
LRRAFRTFSKLHAASTPSHLGNFLGGEFGMTDDPDAFGLPLRRTLAEEH